MVLLLLCVPVIVLSRYDWFTQLSLMANFLAEIEGIENIEYETMVFSIQNLDRFASGTVRI